MRVFGTLLKKEIAAYFFSPVAYIVMIFFLFVVGYSFWMLAGILAQGVVSVTVMNELFGSIFFWLALLVVIPVITMRLFAEEQHSGTIETLMTAPVRDGAVVLAKYFSALLFFVIMWIPTLAYSFIIRVYDPLMSVDLGPMISGYLGAFLVGAFYISIGLFASTLTRNQVVAAIVTFGLVSAIFFSGFIPYLTRNNGVRVVSEYLSPVMHMLDFSAGIVDSRPIVLYGTATLFVLFTAVKVVESRRWKA